MWQVFRSLRFQLVATFVAVVGIINALLSLGGVVVREWQLRTRFDAQLESYADRVAGWRRQLSLEQAAANNGLDDPHQPFAGPGLYVVLRSPTGEVVYASASMRGEVFPLPDGLEFAGTMQPVYHTHAEAFTRNLAGSPESVRVLTRPLNHPGMPDGVLQVGRSFDEVEESLAFLRALFWIIMPAGLFAAAVAAWLVTGRALGRLNVISQIASDITPRHLDRRIEHAGGARDEIGKVVGELNHMLGRLENSFNAQERFIASASHELQTPIAVLLSEAQRLQRREQTIDEYRAFVRSVEQEMRQLSRMVGSLLSLTRMESGDPVRAGKLLPLQELVVEAVDTCCPLAARDSVTIRVQLPELTADADEPLVRGDPQLLSIMVENLLRAAVRYSPRSGEVVASVEVDGDQVIVTVSDSGPPVSDEALRCIRDRRRSEVEDVDGRRGIGLGVVIAQTVAELHGGALGVRNHEQGVAFFVWMPLAQEPGEDAVGGEG